eukprot:scaffold269_cov404-Prasinococcus_capsulatus_cf.AAC.26
MGVQVLIGNSVRCFAGRLMVDNCHLICEEHPLEHLSTPVVSCTTPPPPSQRQRQWQEQCASPRRPDFSQSMTPALWQGHAASTHSIALVSLRANEQQGYPRHSRCALPSPSSASSITGEEQAPLSFADSSGQGWGETRPSKARRLPFSNPRVDGEEQDPEPGDASVAAVSAATSRGNENAYPDSKLVVSRTQIVGGSKAVDCDDGRQLSTVRVLYASALTFWFEVEDMCSLRPTALIEDLPCQ